ncbi:MAG: hypothetical protein FGM58_03540 [Acidimicrobiia bacterium]|nr:hypothetical protein [Acidimicrobiia bacterium]
MVAVHQRRQFRHRRRHLPDRRGLLRVQVALLHLGGELAVRRRRDHPHDDDRRPLRERRHPTAGAGPARDPAGQGPRVGHPRTAGAGEDGRLLAAALRPDLLDAGHRRRRHLYRRQGPAAGDLPVDDHRRPLLRVVHRQHLAAGLDAPGGGRRPVGARLVGGRCHLSGLHPAVRGGTRGVGPETPYIDHNIAATRQALGLDEVDTQPFIYSQDKAVATQNINANPGTIRNVRLLDPSIVNPTFQRLQSQYAAYRFNQLDVDRYPIRTPGGEIATTQVVLGARDLDVNGIPQKSWEGQHLAYTHGYGVALAPANATTTQGRPDFLIRNVPVVEDRARIDVSIDTPQTYFGENVGGYAVTNATREEVDYVEIDGSTKFTQYSGAGGVNIGSFARKAAYALRFSDWNLLVSNFINSDSRIIYQRDVRNRIEQVAPFMQFDADPYPVVSGGRIVYIFDGYTTTDRYPNAQRADSSGLPAASGLSGARFNYVRNSVKAVVDAYDGSVKLYVVDPSDPIVRAWEKAFPALFAGVDEMPAGLKAHWRYPEDLFRVQTNMYGRYHISDPRAFYEKTSSWSVAQDPGATAATTTAIVTNSGLLTAGTPVRAREVRIDPAYMLVRLPGQDSESFVMLRPFVPYSEDDSKKTLTSFMVANSDPAQYGKLTVFEMPSGFNIDGPSIVNANILADQAVSARLTLLNQQGSKAQLGDLVLVPVGNSIVYVRPLYVSSDNTTAVPELKEVIAVFGGEVVMRPTLKEAIRVLFPGASPETFESVTADQPDAGGGNGSGSTTTSTTIPGLSTTTTTTVPSTGNATKDQLIDQAARALVDADAALRNGDLAGYQAKVREAQALLSRVQASA